MSNLYGVCLAGSKQNASVFMEATPLEKRFILKKATFCFVRSVALPKHAKEIGGFSLNKSF